MQVGFYEESASHRGCQRIAARGRQASKANELILQEDLIFVPCLMKETTKPLMANDREKKKSMMQSSRFKKRTLECEALLVLINVMKIISMKKHN